MRLRTLGTALASVITFLVLLAPTHPATAAGTFTVNSLLDTDDGTCTAGSGGCTLREAINAANAASGGTINFNIPATNPIIFVDDILGPQLGTLPDISTPITIDGTTQPGYAGEPLVAVAGYYADYPADGFHLTSGGSGSVIRGLMIGGFPDNGIELVSASSVTIDANWIGDTDTGPTGNMNTGVYITGGGSNLIGTAVGNVISDSQVHDGIGIVASNDNVIKKNRIGTTVDGAAARGNGGLGSPTANGIRIAPGINNQIGGPAPGDGNLIAANERNGIEILGPGSASNLVWSNSIGVNVWGAPLGNGLHGVRIENSTTTSVGVSFPNTIAYNAGDGVALLGTGTNTVYANSIHSNGGLGVDLNDDGLTANDALDADTGPNDLQNRPVLTSATTSVGGGTRVIGTLHSTPSTAFILDVYHSASCDPSGYGEGETFLASVTPINTDGAGNASFDVTFSPSYGYVSPLRSVTAIISQGSEFSNCVTVTCSPPVPSDADCDGFNDPAATVHQGPANTNTAVDNCPTNQNASQTNADGNFFDNSPPYVATTDDKTDPNSDALGDACDSDADNDGIAGTTETSLVVLQGICPTTTGTTDPLKFDTDNDRVADNAECILGSDPTNIASKPVLPPIPQDPDNDKLSNAIEALLGTNPSLFDTDSDGANDGLEVKGWRSNPLVADTDGDAVRDRCEIGSINGDTIVNPGDQALLSAEIIRAVPATSKLPQFDLNRDGAYNPGDQAYQASMVGPGKCP